MTQQVEFTINGKHVVVSADDANMLLVDYLHENQGLTGTKFCCGIGVCRACTVAVRRTPTAILDVLLSCSTPVAQLQGMAVFTIEGLAKTDHQQLQLHPLQQAFLKHFSFQCGYCTSGFLMASFALLDRLQKAPVDKSQVDAFIESALGDHVCRCTGYVRYYQAVKSTILDVVYPTKQG